MDDERKVGAVSPENLIVIVENDPFIGEMLIQVLSQEMNASAILLITGAQTLQFTQVVRPALFLIDYSLPDMDGITLYDNLRISAELWDVPIILLTTNRAQLEDAIAARQLIALSKPFELDELIATIKASLKSDAGSKQQSSRLTT